MSQDRHPLLALLAPVAIALAGATVTNQAPVQPAPAAPAAPADLALAGRITDAAHVLDAVRAATIDHRLARLEQDTGHQLVVVTVPSLNGEDVGRLTLRLARAWAIGRRGFNDGVVLLVAPNERKVRIEVGLGLERVLTNARCAEIIQRRMIPLFREGDLAAGIDAGVAALDQALR